MTPTEFLPRGLLTTLQVPLSWCQWSQNFKAFPSVSARMLEPTSYGCKRGLVADIAVTRSLFSHKAQKSKIDYDKSE